MRKQDLDRDASGSSMILSAFAFMLSVLGAAAYFLFGFSSQPPKVAPVSTEKNYCQDDNLDKEALLKKLSNLKAQIGDDWSDSCQDRLNSVLYETALNKATEGKFSTSFIRLCQISATGESDYFEEAQFLFTLWSQNRNTSGKVQEIEPLLKNFFQNYENPSGNCPVAGPIIGNNHPIPE